MNKKTEAEVLERTSAVFFGLFGVVLGCFFGFCLCDHLVDREDGGSIVNRSFFLCRFFGSGKESLYRKADALLVEVDVGDKNLNLVAYRKNILRLVDTLVCDL